jgi:AraC family transcriptional regulator
MDWVNRMNQAIDYVENNLNQEIDYEEISRIMGCPFSVFQRSFTQITGISLSEYVRNRKLTCAAYDLQNTNYKIIDIAMKYGYESSDAFSVAFKRMHGVMPAVARKSGAKLAFYCRLTFALTIKGVYKMDYQKVERETFKVIGVRRITPYGGGTWAIVKSDGSGKAMEELSGHFCDLGLCFGFGEDGSNDYMCGIEWEKEDVPGFESYVYPAATWLLFEAEGNLSENVLYNTWQRINNEFLPQSKYKKSSLPTIEKYVKWDETADICRVEIQIPVTLK